MRWRLILILGTSLAGCTTRQRVNPSFPVSRDDARAAMRQMEMHPATLERPLVILGGFSDPGFSSSAVRSACRRLFDDERIVVVNFAGTTGFDQCRKRVIDAVDKAFESADPSQTAEVDVIGLSMGGLVARVAAETDAPGERRLRIARLFAVSSPLQGAKLARYPLVLTTMHRDMREGSELLHTLNDSRAPFPIYAYTRLHDFVVGEELAAPAGETAWWVDTPPLGDAHFGAIIDPRIMADIARRLRGEEPFALQPPAPLP